MIAYNCFGTYAYCSHNFSVFSQCSCRSLYLSMDMFVHTEIERDKMWILIILWPLSNLLFSFPHFFGCAGCSCGERNKTQRNPKRLSNRQYSASTILCSWTRYDESDANLTTISCLSCFVRCLFYISSLSARGFFSLWWQTGFFVTMFHNHHHQSMP